MLAIFKLFIDSGVARVPCTLGQETFLRPLNNNYINVVELYTRHFNKVGYSTESRSTGVPTPEERDSVEWPTL